MAEIEREYSVDTIINFPLVTRGAVDFLTALPTLAAGDVQLVLDEAAAVNSTNLPTFIGPATLSLALTAAEMQAARIEITIIDQTATKEWEDQYLLIATYAGSSAQHAFNRNQEQSAASGASINTPAFSFTLTTGSINSGSITDTVALDGVEHRLADAAGTLDAEYEFNVGGSGIPSQLGLTGRSNGGNDDILVQAFDYNSSSFVQVGIITGKAGAANDSLTFTLFSTMVGSGVNAGQVRIRFFNTGLTTAILSIDQLFVSFAVVNLSVGYQDSAVWIDTVNGTAGTTSFVNGTADNPVLTLADATTIASNIGLQRFRVLNGSTITLAQTYDNFVFAGINWSLNLGGQQAANATFEGANVLGTLLSSSTFPRFTECIIGSITVPVSAFVRCAFIGTLSLNTSGDCFFLNCDDGVPGSGAMVVDVGAFLNTNLLFREWGGNVELRNLGQAGTDTVDLEGNGSVTFNATCIGGNVTLAGNLVVTNNGSGLTIADAARFENNKNADHILRRNMAAARASTDGDSVQERALLGAAAKLTNRIDTTTNVGNLTVFEENDSTEFYRQALTTDPNADPITVADTV